MASLIFRKTAQGAQQIAQRSDHLPRPLRNLLILVNGRTDAGSLLGHARALQLDGAALVDLVRRGLIEPMVDEGFRATETGMFARAPVSQAHMTLDALEQLRSVEMARAYAAAFLREATGDASSPVISRFLNATTSADLLALLDDAARTVASVSGADAAARFARRVRRLMPDAPSAPPTNHAGDRPHA